ncbi:uncharacterized protein [Branchiostoma lanceolatum]|uniref:uncharacterized protein n=1 Tax=Branchiostoma lanceolatum TaxID=7740 RepID=UPI00345598CB
MAALEVDRTCVASVFEACDLVYVHCIFEETFKLNWDAFKIVNVNLRPSHVSLVTSMGVRRQAFVADRQWGTGFKTFPAPKLIRVTSSCEMEIRQEGTDDMHATAVCIWEWEDITNVPLSGASRSLSATPAPENMPVLDAGDCPYCCPAFNAQASTSSVDPQQPSTSSVFPQKPTADSQEDSSDEDEDVICNAHIIKLKGSNMEPRYQVVLTEIQKQMLERRITVPVRLEFEMENPVDSNAIKIDAQVDGIWKVIGYIPIEKVPKVTSALRKTEIVSVKLASIPKYEFNPNGRHGFGVSIVIVKKGKWPADDRHNKYNSNLSYI